MLCLHLALFMPNGAFGWFGLFLFCFICISTDLPASRRITGLENKCVSHLASAQDWGNSKTNNTQMILSFSSLN